MTAAREVGKAADAATAAAEALIRSHREWYEQAVGELERRLADLEAREQKAAAAERSLRERREKIQKAIAEAERVANA
jgi:hypothetical protein